MEDGPYQFAKFNTTVSVPEYTDEEYEMIGKDPDWTKEETDYLFAMCRDFDLRFIIIHDRYTWMESDRSLEDLKDRYFSLARRILEARTPIPLMTATQLDEVNALSFDKDKEIQRKAHVATLLLRSPQQIAEEEALIGELRRLNANEKKMARERAELLKLLDAPPTIGSIGAYSGSQGLASLTNSLAAGDRENKKKRAGSESHHHHHHSASLASNAVGSASDKQNNTLTAKKLRRMTPKEEAQYGITIHDSGTGRLSGTSSFLRSQKIPPLKLSLQTRVSSVMTELNIPPRLAMPTSTVCTQYEKLQNTITLMLEAKRQYDKLEQEIKVQTAVAHSDGAPPVETSPNESSAPEPAPAPIVTAPQLPVEARQSEDTPSIDQKQELEPPTTEDDDRIRSTSVGTEDSSLSSRRKRRKP